MGSHPNITNTLFPRQGAFLGRRVQVVFHYGSESVCGVVVRDDSEAPGETIIRLDNGRFVRSVECQWRPDRSAEEAGANGDATEERLDELLADRDWDDCDKGDAYDVLSEIQAQRDEARISVADLERENAALRGITPDLGPRPPDGAGMPRFGLRWNGPTTPLSVPMADGYWTPWHLAQKRVTDLETALATLLDAAERQAAGFPLAAEEWFAVRDYARARLPEKSAASAEPLFYVQCTSRSRDCAVWWRPNGNGYTCDLSQAGLYPAGGEWAEDCALWPREVVERISVRHVRTETLAAGERAEVSHG